MGASIVKTRRKALIGRKIGMTQIFRDDGSYVPVTVLEVGPCTVLQVKTPESDGYASLQVGYIDTTKRLAYPQEKLFLKVKVPPKKVIREIPALDPAAITRLPLFSEVGGTVEYRGLEAGKNLIDRKVPGSKKLRTRVVSPPPGQPPRSAADPAAAEPQAESPPGAPANGGEAPAAGAAGPAPEGPAASLAIKDSSGKVIKEYPLPVLSSIEVAPGTTVSDGDLLAYVPVQDKPEAIVPGQQIGVGIFRETYKVDVSGVNKGYGFQGCIKRYHFQSGPKSHGTKNIREPGSTGMHTDPGRVPPGKRMPGQMGAVHRKARNLEVVEVDAAQNLMLVRGAVPGPNGGIVVVQESQVARKKEAPKPVEKAEKPAAKKPEKKK